MKKENILLGLWIVFGYLFITAINSIIYLIAHFIYFGLFELAVSFKIMKLILPSTTLILYGLIAYILIRRVDKHSKISEIHLTNFPKKLIVITAIIAFTLSPITNALAGFYAGTSSVWENIDFNEYVDFDIWFHYGFTFSKLAVIVVILIVFLIRLRNLNNNQSTV